MIRYYNALGTKASGTNHSANPTPFTTVKYRMTLSIPVNLNAMRLRYRAEKITKIRQTRTLYALESLTMFAEVRSGGRRLSTFLCRVHASDAGAFVQPDMSFDLLYSEVSHKRLESVAALIVLPCVCCEWMRLRVGLCWCMTGRMVKRLRKGEKRHHDQNNDQDLSKVQVCLEMSNRG